MARGRISRMGIVVASLALAGLSAPVQAQFGGILGGAIRGATSSPQGGCKSGKPRSLGSRSAGGALGGAASTVAGNVSPVFGWVPIAGLTDQLTAEIACKLDPQEQKQAAQATLDFVREAKTTGVRVSVLPRILELVGSAMVVEDVYGLTLLGLRRLGLSRSSLAVKRSFDLLGASIGLVVVSPVLALAALIIKLDTRGTVFYKQPRVGRDGKLFEMVKFRTMVHGADAMKSDLIPRNEAGGICLSRSAILTLRHDARRLPAGGRCLSPADFPGNERPDGSHHFRAGHRSAARA